MSRPYLYHWHYSLPKSHKLCMAITRQELGNAGFELASKPVDWAQFAFNDDTLLVITCVPLSDGQAHVHVVGTSNNEASAKRWASDLMERIKTSNAVLFDDD